MTHWVKIGLTLVGILIFIVSVSGAYWLGRIQEREQGMRVAVQQLGSCKSDDDCVIAIPNGSVSDGGCPAAYSREQLKKDKNLILYESHKKRNNNSEIMKICTPNPVAFCHQEGYCSLRSASQSCIQDSDCPQGLVCAGRGPTQPSAEIPGVCVTSKGSQGVQ